MEKLGVIIGIAVAVAIVVFLRDRRAAQGQRLRAAAIGLVVAGVAAAAAVYGLAAMRENGEETASVDQAMALVPKGTARANIDPERLAEPLQKESLYVIRFSLKRTS